jgi:hypothetical protein
VGEAPIIGKLLGHSHAATTQRYAHLDNDPLRKASEQIAGHLAAAMGDNVSGTSATFTDINEAKGSKNRRG